MSYQKLLLTAREQAEARLNEKGLGSSRERKFVDAPADEEILMGKPLVSRPEKSLEDEGELQDDFMTSYYNKLYKQNQELRSQIEETLTEVEDSSLRPKTYEQVMGELKHPEKAETLRADPAFMAKLANMQEKFPGLKEQEVFKIIEGESRYNPTAKSEAGAVGLFQMMPETLAEIGFTPDEVINMEPTEQLSVYESYLKRWDYDGSFGLGIVQAAPAYRKSSPNTVVYKKGSKEWKMNPGWRSANNGDITKRSIEAYYGRVE